MVDQPVTVRIQSENFNPGEETNAFLKTSDGAGAAVTFTGMVRSTNDAPIKALTLEHYPALASTQLTKIAQEALNRFGLIRITLIHRFGTLTPGEPIVQVMTLAEHRRAAFESAEFLMDYLKTNAPFWKKEKTADGETWVDAKSIDDTALERWE